MPQATRLKRRAAQVRQELRRYGLDALLVTARANVAWLTGLRCTAGAALLAPDGLELIVDFRYYEQAALEAPTAQRVLVEGARYDAAVAQALAGKGVRRLAFEADHLSVAEHMGIAGQLRDVELVPSRGLVEVCRAVKDELELAAIRRAAAITSEAVADAIAALGPGTTERELAWAIEAGFRARGAEGPAFPTLVAAGARAALPHPRPGERPLVPGDWVLVDAGAMVDGYRADMTRSFVLGAPTPRQAAAWEAVHAALRAGIAAVRPGQPAGAVDAACRRTLARLGYGRLFGHDAGHGVGLDLHEAPRVAAGSDEALEPGMVLTVEPGLYEPGVGGVRLEELVLVTSDGAELLTTAPLAMTAQAMIG